MSRPQVRWGYAAVGCGAAVVALLLSWTSLATQFDNNIYDFMHRLRPAGARQVQAVVLAFDDRTLVETGDMRNIRRTLARTLDTLASAPPAVVAIDLTLAATGLPEEDAALGQAAARLPKVVMACEMMGDGSAWQDPAPVVRGNSLLGHVHTLPGPLDDVNRAIALERAVGRERRWALSVEAYRAYRGVPPVEESPGDVRIGDLRIESRQDEGRPLLVRYRPPADVERVAVRDVLNDPARAQALKGRVVFIGVTSLSGADDRLFTPVSPLNQNRPSPGVEIHAQAFETLASGDLFSPASTSAVLLLVFGAALAVALSFMLPRSRWAYAAAIVILLAVHLLPWWFFRSNIVLPSFGPVATAWAAFIGGAAFRFFIVRRQLTLAEAQTDRYQQAFRFVAHEMRTPLTAIQGSSEMISRYNLPEDKRKQLGLMINAESKRLAGMITTFLDVERVGAGQMDLRLLAFPVAELAHACIERARPLWERKRIEVEAAGDAGLDLKADRELLEFALYNLVTNAVKYSPEGSRVDVRWTAKNGRILIAVHDQGMGMSREEQKGLFQKFYRTRTAEKSGIQGTGIGLSIVKQIAELHSGHVTVESEAGKGSTFTLEV